MTSFFLHRITLCPAENTLVRWMHWIHRIHRTIWLSQGCHNHQADRLHTFLIELNPACHDVIFSPSDNSLFYGKHPLSDGSIGSIGQSDFHEVATITRQAACTSLIELKPACHDVIFSPSDNSLSDGEHACPMDPSDLSDNLTLPQSPSTPLAHIPNWIKPCLSWRHFFSIG